MKKLLMIVMALAAGMAAFGESAAFARASMRLDTRAGVRIAAKGESETIAYSPRWARDGGRGATALPSCTVTADGATLKTASEEGEVEWSPDSTGAHTLTHTAGDVVYTAQFTVLGDDVAQHAGALAANETWGSNQVHLVTADVTVPSGKTLTIEPGAVVKFMTGTSLTVNGTCMAKGVIFTHVKDDTVGGDTLMDGDAAKPVMDGYKLSGNIYEDDATEERYTAPQTLTSSISGTLRLKGHKVYLANSSITVNSGATLTLLPGAIIKFASGCSMTVNGTLDAQGTRAAPIVFTSQKDDDWGGDTNGDGEKTEGEAGDWHQITGSGTVKMNYCQVLWCSAQNNQGALYPNGGTWTFDNSIVAHCQYDCMRSYGGTFNANNSVFMDSSMGAAPSSGTCRFVNCVFYYLTTAVRWGCGSYYNCIFANIAEDIIDTKFYSSTVNSPFGHCCFWAPNAMGDKAAAKVGKDGNIYADPKFVDPDNGDFRIAADSPCVDAGDGTVAPELDYWGQPRMDAKGKNATGVPNADGVCPDIGIYEFPGKVTIPVADLAVLSVTAPATAVPGEEIALTYVVTNRGAAEAVGMVRDRFQLKGADAALGGQTVAAGEVEQAYSLAAGAAATLTARVKCPTVKSGNWTVGITVNAERDVFEQVTANNTGWASEPTAVELAGLSVGESRLSVAAGTAKGFALGDGVKAVRIASDAALDKIAVYGANGAVPSSAEGGVSAVRLDDGSWLLVLPEAKTDEKGYVVIENGGTAEVELKVTAEEEKLVLYGVGPSRVAAVDGVSVTITGTGLAEDQTVMLGGRTATRVTKVDEAQVVATFDLKGMAAGTSEVAVSGGADGVRALPIEVYKTTVGPKLEARLELPSSVRDGRIYTAYVVYANVGDEPMTMPVFKVVRTDSSTKLGLTTGAALTETKVFVGGIAPNHPAGVLQPGDSGRIPVFFMPSGTYGLKLTHTKETDNTEQFKAFGGVKPYLAAMSEAATRLNLRGKTAYNVHDFVDQAEAEKNGVPSAAVSGTVRNATTAEVLPGVAVALVSTNGLGVVETVTDENGYFQLPGLADGIYHFNLAGGYELDSAPVDIVEITDQADRNDIGVLVRVGGCVRGTVSVNDGVPLEGARVVIEGDSGKTEEVKTDGCGGYAFASLLDGAYKVGVCGTDGYAGELKTNVVVDAVNRSVTIDFCLVRGGVVRGEVTGIGTDVTNGCVWAMTVSGDVISTTCDDKGGFEFPGLAANTYTFQYQSAQHVSDISTIDVLAGTTCSVNLSAQARPLFRTTQKIGFGSLETSFVFEDYNRSTNITSWAWDFDADGTVDSCDPSPTHTYTSVGTNTVVLTFVEDGVTYSTTNVACAIVEEPIETVYTDKAVVLGVNAGGLAAVELMADGVLVLTGTPDRTLTVGDVVVGAIGDDGFARRVLAVKGDSTRWELQTEDAPIEDVFVSVGMAGRSVQRRQVRRQMAASKTSANVLNAASSETSGGSGKKRFYTEGGGSFDFNYDFDISIDYALKRLNGKTYWRIVPVLTFERTIKSEFQIGAGVHQKVSESAETPPVLCITAGPIPVPVVTGHFEVEFYASWDVGGKFVGGSEDFVRDTFKYGYEYYEGQLNVVKEHHVDHDSPKSQWDVEGSANAEVGAFFGFKLRALAVMSASIGPKFAVGIKANESLHSPSKVSIYGKLGVEAEANLIDLDFNLSPFDFKGGVTWFWGITSDLVSYTGPTADFSMTPPSGEAPLHVDFSYTGAKEKTQFLWWEKEYTPWKLSWKGTNWDGDPDGKLTESEGDYNSEAKWPVKLSVRGHVMNVLWPKTKTKYVIVGDPEETPDDGDDVTDNTGGGTPAKSCDPNEMAGPLGAGDPETERFVKPGEWMDYTIYFENKADADVPAQEVFVDAQLSEYLDWSTFEMGEVAFNNQNETVLAGLKNGMKTVAQNGADYKVQLSVEFDETTGVAHWYLRSYDPSQPEYNYWPAAVDAGFLPPNDETHRGEGHITYRVKVREDAPKGVRIDAAATIVFDQNDPIPTDPAWWNTVGSAGGEAAFAESELTVNEGGTLKVTVSGGHETLASSVQVLATYNTAAAADLDLKKAKVNGATVKSFKFPVTLAWAAGETGEKTVEIPVLVDKAVEADEFLTLQLANPMNLEIAGCGGEGGGRGYPPNEVSRVSGGYSGATALQGGTCTVTIHDSKFDALKAAVESGTATKAQSNDLQKIEKALVGKSYVRALANDATRGKVTGSALAADGKKVTLKATANKGWVFAGWYTDPACTAGHELTGYGDYRNPSLAYANTNGAVTVYARFIPPEEDSLSLGEDFLPGEFAPGADCRIAVPVESVSYPTVKVTGLPSGMKFADKDTLVKATKTTDAYTVEANTIYGAPTKASSKPVTVTVTVKNLGGYQIVRKYEVSVVATAPSPSQPAKVVSDAAPYQSVAIDLSDDFAGKVTGAGVYQAGKKVTLKATANKGHVFNGWYLRREGAPETDDEPLTQAASYSFSMPSNDVSFTAKFVTAEEDRASIGASVDGMAFGAASGGEGAAETKQATNVWAGVYLEWPVAASALSETTVKVAGLPGGLKFTAKPVTSKVGSGKTAVTVTNVAANTIYGAPSAASKTTKAKDGSVTVVPTAVKVTVTTAGKNKQTYQIDMTVDPLPAWAVGTFAGPSYDGDDTNGVASVTVATSGKITAKQPVAGKAVSFSATCFDRYDAEAGAYVATLTAKVGTNVVTNVMAVTAAESGMGFIAAERFDAWQYNWKVEPWKTIGKSFDKREMSYEEDGVRVTLKFSASGTAKVAGEFAKLDDEGNYVYNKYGVLQTVTATGSATLLPTLGEGGETRYIAFVYLAPKDLPAHARCVEVAAEVVE